MGEKTRKNGRPWWRRRRALRRLAVLGALSLVVVGVAWLVVRGEGGSGSGVYLREPAPPFTLPTVAGEEVSLSDHIGRHNVLLYLSEGIGCAPCWDQIVDIEEDWGRFQALDLELVSIMVDPMDQMKAEAQRLGITTTLAADEDKAVSNAYDAMEASMHPGIKPGHSFVLIDKTGQMIWRWDWIGHGKPMYFEVDELYSDVSKWLEQAGA